MQIREIVLEDYEKLVPFWRENYFVNEHDSLPRFILFLQKNPSLSIIAEEGGVIAGTALGSYDGRRGYLQKVVVGKDFQRKGLGKELVQKMLAKLKAAGVSYIPMNVEKDSVAFYEKCGFKVTSQVPMNIDL